MGKALNPELEKLLEESIQRNIEKALEKTMKQVQQNEENDIYTQKTEKILKNYNILKLQTEDVILDINILQEVKEKKINELMKDIFVKDDDSIEEVILNSKKKTKIFVDYMEKILKKYIEERKSLKTIDNRKHKKEIRKILILENYYMTKEYEREDFLDEYNMTLPTFLKDNKELIEEIKILIFGIDGLNVL